MLSFTFRLIYLCDCATPLDPNRSMRHNGNLMMPELLSKVSGGLSMWSTFLLWTTLVLPNTQAQKSTFILICSSNRHCTFVDMPAWIFWHIVLNILYEKFSLRRFSQVQNRDDRQRSEKKSKHKEVKIRTLLCGQDKSVSTFSAYKFYVTRSEKG